MLNDSETNKQEILAFSKNKYIYPYTFRNSFTNTHTRQIHASKKQKKIEKHAVYIERKGTQRKKNHRENCKQVANKINRAESLVAAMDQHKTPVYRYHRSITKLAREFWHGGWVEIYANRSESVAGVTITTPWEGLQFWRQFNLNRSCKRELWANVYRGNRL